MIAAILIYTLIFWIDFRHLKKDKNGRRLFILLCALGAFLVILLFSDIKITTPAVVIMKLLEISGLHY